MAPRNPDESPEEDERMKPLQIIHDDLGAGGEMPDVPVMQKPPASKPAQEEPLASKVEPDRLEVYLKGPTVFTA